MSEDIFSSFFKDIFAGYSIFVCKLFIVVYIVFDKNFDHSYLYSILCNGIFPPGYFKDFSLHYLFSSI